MQRKRKSSSRFLIVMTAVIMTLCLSAAGPAPAYTSAAEQITAQTDTNKDLKIDSKSGAVYDRGAGVFLYDKEANKRRYPASTTKILTALVVLENCDDLNKTVTVSQHAIDSLEEGSSHIALVPGEKVTITDLLYGLLLESGNDCANVLAEEIGGDEADFAEMMNAKAKELGAKDSHFVNPHGWYNKDHYTTAHDLALIMDECLNNETFVKIDSALKYKIKKTNKSKSRELWNSHRMIKNKYAYYEGVRGGKSGFTIESKCNLITDYEKDGTGLIVVVLRNGTPHGCVLDTEALLDFYLMKHEKIAAGDSPETGTVEVERKTVPYTEDSVPEVIVPTGVTASDLEKTASFKKDLELPVEKDQKIGTETISYQGKVVGKTDLISTGTVKSNRLFYVLAAIAAAVVIFYVAVALMMRSKSKKRRKNRRRNRSIFS